MKLSWHEIDVVPLRVEENSFTVFNCLKKMSILVAVADCYQKELPKGMIYANSAEFLVSINRLFKRKLSFVIFLPKKQYFKNID